MRTLGAEVLSIAAAITLIGAVPVADAAQRPCKSDRQCKASVRVADRTVHTTSAARFAADEGVNVRLHINGKEVEPHLEAMSGCDFVLSARGVTVRVKSSCKKTTPLRFSVSSVRSKPTRVTLRYWR